MLFAKATRQAVRLKIGIQGPSGSGKTLGALALATALAPNGKVAVIDTENGSASLYGDRFQFDTLNLGAPYTTARYMEAIDAAVSAGYEVIVLDSISHQWMGEGGILSRKELLDSRGGNSYTNWAKFTVEHEQFKAKLLSAPVHLVATVRAKQDYVVEQTANGKSAPRKIGMAPVQREGMEYEFSIVFELQMDHRAMVSKDRTGLFEGGMPLDLAKPEIVDRLRGWLASGAAVTVARVQEAKAVLAGAEATAGVLTSSAHANGVGAADMKLPGTKASLNGFGGKRIGEVDSDALETIMTGLRESDAAKFSTYIEAIGKVLADRAGAAV